jgi:NAD(P)-dependent dehydrogenase (short-subunit alcohol dehydrogenase family)
MTPETAPHARFGTDERPLVVVTGGSGLVGSRLIGRLLDGYRIVNLDLDGDPESSPDIDFICTDLTSDASVQRAVDRIERYHGNHVASIVHLAAFYDFAGEDNPLYDEVTVQDATPPRRHAEGEGRPGRLLLDDARPQGHRAGAIDR